MDYVAPIHLIQTIFLAGTLGHCVPLGFGNELIAKGRSDAALAAIVLAERPFEGSAIRPGVPAAVIVHRNPMMTGCFV
jgi:hypothetical protein